MMGLEPRMLTSFETTRAVAGCVYRQRGGAQIPTRARTYSGSTTLSFDALKTQFGANTVVFSREMGIRLL